MNAEIPSAVRELLEGPVRSIEALEALTTLCGMTGDVAVTDLAASARLSLEGTQTAIDELVAGGLAVRVPPASVRYEASDPKLAQAVEELVQTYAQRRVDLLVLISANAMKRVRRGALATFSEAFRVRGPKKDG